MTQIFATDASCDIFIGTSGNLEIYTGLRATEQACEHAAKAQLGEMVLAVTQGIPYLETVWNGTPNLPQFDAALRGAFLGIPGVVEVVSLVFKQVGDVLQYTAVIGTIYGQGTASGGIVNG